MRKNTPSALIDQALRDLDPAASPDLPAAAAAEALLARIVAQPVDAPAVPARADEQSSRGRRVRRWAAVVGIGSSAAAGAFLLGGGDAYATWTAQPTTLSGNAASSAEQACLDALGESDRGRRGVLSERRGDWVFTLLLGPSSRAVCLLPYADGADRPTGRGFLSSDPDTLPPPPPPADGLDETDAMSGTTEDGWLTWSAGTVGSDVTGVTVVPSSGPRVEASVVDGRFAAWWPDDGTSWTYILRLADGTSRRVGPGQ